MFPIRRGCYLVCLIIFLFPLISIGQYLSDLDKTYKELERIQQLDDSSNNLLWMVGDSVFTKSNSRQLLRKMAQNKKFHRVGWTVEETYAFQDSLFDKYLSNYPTRYQDPANYLVLAQEFEEIEKVVKEYYPQLYKPAKYGSYYSNSLIAENISRNGEYLILIHPNIGHYCSFVGKIAAQIFKDQDLKNFLINGYDTAYYARIIDGSPDMARKMLNTFFRFKYKKFHEADSLNTHTDKWLGPKYIEKAWDYWSMGCEQFFLGHEYAHTLLQHSKDVSSEFVSDTTILRSWQNEIEADELSQMLLAGSFKTLSEGDDDLIWKNYGMFGGIFFLKTIFLYENLNGILETDSKIEVLNNADHNTILEILNNKNDLSGNLKRLKTISPYFRKLEHPPIGIRINLLYKLLERQTSGKLEGPDVATVENMMSLSGVLFAHFMLYTIERLGKTIEPAMHVAHQNKEELKQFYKE